MEVATGTHDHVAAEPPTADWQRNVVWARRLAWVSLAVLLIEGAVGLWEGLTVRSIALTGWALGGASEGLASAMVLWRFTGDRTLSPTAERSAQRGVAISFWLVAPYVAAESVRHLVGGEHAEASVLGIGLTALALVLMPLLGWANHRVGARLHSGATEGGRHPELLVRHPGRGGARRIGRHRGLARRVVDRSGDRTDSGGCGDVAGRTGLARQRLLLIRPDSVQPVAD